MCPKAAAVGRSGPAATCAGGSIEESTTNDESIDDDHLRLCGYHAIPVPSLLAPKIPGSPKVGIPWRSSETATLMDTHAANSQYISRPWLPRPNRRSTTTGATVAPAPPLWVGSENLTTTVINGLVFMFHDCTQASTCSFARALTFDSGSCPEMHFLSCRWQWCSGCAAARASIKDHP
ncbi:hypothetical protein MKZ38_002468 [Zalerion maritima]|uniref:Uncharacterized protein n=1 Tax=Zalerion maritima TaxID=339359 RepID=A0AAD5RNX3_9PEZI|nr:hypothetical protein MKZ38_002468 [Zalerion maritima]